MFPSILNGQTVLFDPLMGPLQVLPPRIRVDLAVMGIKRYSTFPKTSALEPHHQMQFSVITKTLVLGVSYSSAEMQSGYSSLSGNWATRWLSVPAVHTCPREKKKTKQKTTKQKPKKP